MLQYLRFVSKMSSEKEAKKVVHDLNPKLREDFTALAQLRRGLHTNRDYWGVPIPEGGRGKLVRSERALLKHLQEKHGEDLPQPYETAFNEGIGPYDVDQALLEEVGDRRSKGYNK